MVSIARKNLLEDIPRFLVAQAGIMFAVSLVTIQTGIFKGFTGSSAKLIDNSNADIWVASETMVYLDLTLPLPLADINLAQQVDGVDRAEPLIASGGMWRHPGGEIAPIRVIGFDPQGQLFTPKNLVQGSVSALKQPYTVIVDKTNAGSLNARQIGDQAEVNSLPVQVVGLTQGNRSVASNPYMFTSLESANAYLLSGRTATLSCKTRSGSTDFQCTNIYVPSDRSSTPQPKPLASSDSISYILIRAKPGQNLQALKQKLNAALPSTRAYTRKEMAQKTQNYWQERTGIGYLLSLGATVGIIVGVIIVAQILYSSVSDHIKEFGTLKAMGASDWTIYGVIIEQALWMAVLGYTPGMVLCLGLAAWTLATQGILILITPVTALTVFGITIVMCVGSAVFAIQKVTRVDPAIVFKA
ncbi:ABC transporter permease [Aetokthonos hydrillicola Thurmond2011]|jgi:putative ABC transport system permease protein|uniref:ABC transporter permease n=1 Tax=Aetokthonos hydrillicola Thurmond2011 TaxID=2712845 RepID=A0AAP5I9V5_9CYAN|nr:FtsX-like permease family protein [Aetokthonos hydrillicola]MBW4588807.1 ABC transporter permease [Aetokthonos hydrillicola CCALA 1050]MDR9897329.1 ABC transporter permease [Aetokthonos hydrillicola Thurmond2011]